jgi:formate hydrogenlyase subunit 6/NADH:ubiquinone oxidoreductase subunit I
MLGHSGGESVKRLSTLPAHLPVKRMLLLSCMLKLGKLSEESIDSPLFCQFGVNDDCTGCQMCAFFCPTGALSKLDEDGQVGVRFKISNCTGCGLCQEICYRHAVLLSNHINLRDIMSMKSDIIDMPKGLSPGQGKCIDWPSVLNMKNEIVKKNSVEGNRHIQEE